MISLLERQSSGTTESCGFASLVIKAVVSIPCHIATLMKFQSRMPNCGLLPKGDGNFWRIGIYSVCGQNHHYFRHAVSAKSRFPGNASPRSGFAHYQHQLAYNYRLNVLLTWSRSIARLERAAARRRNFWGLPTGFGEILPGIFVPSSFDACYCWLTCLTPTLLPLVQIENRCAQ